MEFFSRTSWGPQASGTSTSSTGKSLLVWNEGLSSGCSTSDLFDSYVGRRRRPAVVVVGSWGAPAMGGKPFLHARKRCAHNVVNRFPLTQFCRLLPDLCGQTFLLHKARAVRGPMISSRGMRPAACSTLR